jgi:hypothetical protein
MCRRSLLLQCGVKATNWLTHASRGRKWVSGKKELQINICLKLIFLQMLLFIQMPYAEDVRSFLFADLNKIELEG